MATCVTKILYVCRSESLSSKEDPAAFLANLESLWSGFVDMPAVAKLLTKVYPVSGTLDHLTEVNGLCNYKPSDLRNHTFDFKYVDYCNIFMSFFP